MAQKLFRSESGQNLVVFAVIIVVLIALVGLAIDGGFGLVNRRQAQNAADAGALAGASILCKGGTEQVARDTALEYATDKNNADSAVATVVGDVITVTTTIEHPTFLMNIFGTDVVTSNAVASAGCYVPCTIKGVLPVAWYCQTPIDENSNECGIKYPPLEGNPQLWIIMDSIKTVDDICQVPPNSGQPPGAVDCDVNNDGVNDIIGGVCQDPITHLPADALDCDLDNDGVNEILAGGDDSTGGNRAWLDLNGSGSDSGNGSNELRQWVLNGFGGTLENHTWFAGQSGVANDIYQAADDILNAVVLLPVFNEYPCSGLPDVNCPELFHTEASDGVQDKIVESNGTSSTYYHVITFAAFKITCVDAPGTKNSDKPCPGKTAALAANPQIPNNIKTIEGYFVEEDAGTGKCEGPDAGVHTIYLNH